MGFTKDSLAEAIDVVEFVFMEITRPAVCSNKLKGLIEVFSANFDGVDLAGPQFDSLNLAFQGAIEGLGIAMGIDALVRDDLGQGRLVRLFDVSRLSRRPFHLVYPAAKAGDPRLARFRDWLLEKAAMSEAK